MPIDTQHTLFNPTDEHRMLRDAVANFVKAEVEPQALAHDKKELFNLTLFKKLASLGLLGLTASTEYGGAQMDAVAACIVHEELSTSDPGFCLAYLAHSILCVNNIEQNCSKEQKDKYLPKLCSGEWVGAMGLSEPAAGTDVLGMKTTAVPKDDGYELNGRKLWITNGTIDEAGNPCNVLWLYALNQKNGSAKPSISTFIVEGNTQGFSVGQKIKDKCGMRASNTAELCFDSCKLPKSQLVGQEGSSLLHMMRNLEIERVTLAAMSVGIARRSLEIMVKYANERTAFGKPISSFGQLQVHIAESYARFKAAKSYLYETARNISLAKNGHRIDSDGVKLFAAQVGKEIADRAMQVLGGFGYVGEYTVERLWRDAKLLEIGGGTIEAHQKNITVDLSKLAKSDELNRAIY